MSKRQITVRLNYDTYHQLEKIQQKRKISINDLINEACLDYVRVEGQEAADRMYAPIMEGFVNQRLASFENRIASLMAKNALDSAMAMFLLIDSISRARNIDPEELYQSMRSMAVKHVQKRDEMLEIIKNSI